MTKELTPEEALALFYTANPSAVRMTAFHMPSLYARDFANLVLAKHSGGSPEEKREAERKAWDAAVVEMRYQSDVSRFIVPGAYRGPAAERDHRYPLLKPEPPTVTLSDGYIYIRGTNPDGSKYWERRSRENTAVVLGGRPVCETAADHLAIHAILKAEEAGNA